MKKRLLTLGLGIALVAATTQAQALPTFAEFQLGVTTLAQKILNQPQVEMELSVAKKVVTQDDEGKPQVTWQSLGDQPVVQPGDVLRYQVESQNQGDVAAANFVVTQPIPNKTLYVLDSTTTNNEANITYSIDGGQTFVAEPTIEVKQPDGTIVNEAAPADRYTHIRWKFGESVAPNANLLAAYQVTVR